MHRSLDRFQLLLRYTVTAALALSALFLAYTSSAKAGAENPNIGAISISLTGKLLVAAPSMPDPRFAETVIFMVRHDRHGAMGLVVNRVIGSGSAARLLEGADINAENLDADAMVRVHYGGPVEPRRGFVLHSNDYSEEGTLEVTNHVSITAAAQILHAMAKGKGPNQGFLAVGYASWSSGQLESELARTDWLVVPSDDQLVFDTEFATKWRRAMSRHGIVL